MGEQVWTIHSMLDWMTPFLERAGDANPRLSAQWLVSAATGLSRLELYTDYERPLSASELGVLRGGVQRRSKGEPLQYITGSMPFRHLLVPCAPGALIPRPETEILVDCVLEYLDALGRRDDDAQVLEIGTGTGCISASIATEREHVHVCATDISPEAHAIARANLEALVPAGRVDLYLCDLADAVPHADEAAFDVLVSNPPYIPSEVCDGLPREVIGFEPRLALDGGPDGLDVFRRIVDLASRALRPGGLLACELHEDCLDLASRQPGVQAAFEDVRIVKDLPGRDRILLATRKREAGSQGADGRAMATAQGDAADGVRWGVCDVTSPDFKLEDWIRKVEEPLVSGALMVFPTDTVWGVGFSVAAHPEGAGAIYALKDRPASKAIPWLVDAVESLDTWAGQREPWVDELARAFWPGPLTLVVPASDAVPGPYLGQGGTIALRMPNHRLAQCLVSMAGGAMAVTSANISGRPSPATLADLDPRIIEGVCTVVADVECQPLPGFDDGCHVARIGALSSTIVDCTGSEPVILREGVVTAADIRAAISG